MRDRPRPSNREKTKAAGPQAGWNQGCFELGEIEEGYIYHTVVLHPTGWLNSLYTPPNSVHNQRTLPMFIASFFHQQNSSRLYPNHQSGKLLSSSLSPHYSMATVSNPCKCQPPVYESPPNLMQAAQRLSSSKALVQLGHCRPTNRKIGKGSEN